MNRNHRDHQKNVSQRFTSDDRTYPMNDRSSRPMSDGRYENHNEESFIGSRGFGGYEDYPGTRQGRKDFGTQPRDEHESEGRFQGHPGLSDRSGNARFSSTSSQGYRPYQDYGDSARSGSFGSSANYDRGHFGKGPKGYKRSDEKIHDEVCEVLTSHYEIDASEIEVEVKDGIVTLGGTVESRRVKRMSEDLVADMNGVQDVRNNMRILSHDSRGLSSGSPQQDGRETGYRSPAASTDSSLSNAGHASTKTNGKVSANPTSTNRQ